MDFTYKFEKLKNGIELFDVKDPSTLTSMLIVVIKRGSKDDPVAYGGTYHYMEHMLGSYFEYSKYGTNYDHLSMMNGSTVSTYLHIYKRFLFTESTLDTLIDNLCVFISTSKLNKNILENEKWMVNNETTSKLYEHPLMNIFFIFEQLQTGRLSSTFGRVGSLNEQALMTCKRSLTGDDYCIFLVNVPSSSVRRQRSELSRLHFKQEMKSSNASEENRLEMSALKSPIYTNRIVGKNLLLINSTYNLTCMIFPTVEPSVLLYMQCTGNDIYEFTYNCRPYVVQNYNDSLIIYTSEINSIVYTDDDLVRMYTEVYIQFLYKIYKAPISDSIIFFVYFYSNIVTNPIYFDLMKSYKLHDNINKQVYNMHEQRVVLSSTSITEMIGNGKTTSAASSHRLLQYMDTFVETFEPRFPLSIDFVLARMTNKLSSSLSTFDNYNQDTGLYYSLVPYTKQINIDLHRLSSSLNSDLLLTINIDYKSGIIYSNTMSNTNRTTYLCIELDINSSNSYGYGFLVFYFLSGCMPYYYTLYDDRKMIMNCTYQNEKRVIESNLNELRYSDLYNLALKLKSNNYDIMNSKNMFFYLILSYLNRLDMHRLEKRGRAYIFNSDMNTFHLHLLNYSKMISTEVPVNMKFLDKKEVSTTAKLNLDISLLMQLKRDYLVIYNECDDIILGQIFIQYIYSLMQKLSRMRRIYTSNMRTGFNTHFYLILLNVQVKNLRDEILNLYDMLDDKLEGVDFDIDVNVILINIIKLMLYNNMSKFRSQFDVYSIDVMREFIDIQMNKLRVM